MTIPEFLERLRATDAKWVLVEGRDIRCEAGDCPITHVANTELAGRTSFTPGWWDDAAAALDLDFDDAQDIVDAADLNDDFNEELREKLLAVTVRKGTACP